MGCPKKCFAKRSFLCILFTGHCDSISNTVLSTGINLHPIHTPNRLQNHGVTLVLPSFEEVWNELALWHADC